MSQNVTRLKELLFDRESATLAELQDRIAEVAATGDKGRQELARTLEQTVQAEVGERHKLAREVEGAVRRAGTEEQFRSSVAGVLDGALREAEATRHDQLSRAMAPLVVKTIKTELRNSQDEMVEALYPITGRLVKTYIASAMKDLMDDINRRLSGGSNPLMLRLRSLMTGRPVAELALAETQRLEVAELFLIRRGSGELVQHWPAGPQGAGVPSNSDIHLSGVLTAINDFASQALKDDGGNLRAFALDDFQMFLRASPAYLLAAKCRGTAPPGAEAILDDEFLRLIERNGKALTGSGEKPPASLLAPLAERLETRLDEQRRSVLADVAGGFNPLKAIAMLLALPLLAYLGWSLFTNYEAAQVRDFATRAIAATPQLAGYPAHVDVGYRGREVTVTGLAPTTVVKTDLATRLRDGLAGTSVVDRLAVLPNASAEFEPQVAGVRRALAGIEGEAYRGAVRRALTRAGRRLDQTVPHLRRVEAELNEPAARTRARSVAESLERIAGELRTQQTRLGTGPIDMAQLNALSAPLHGHSERLRQVGAELAALLPGAAGTVEPAHADATPADILESAEELGLAAEQVATVAVAVAQSARIKPVVSPPVPPSARARLDEWVKANAIFFSDGNDYRNQRAAEAAVERLAMLVREAQVVVRVVGYTDERGAVARNTSLSQTRAQRVADALIERGVPRALLVVVGRTNGIDISSSVGPQSANRRVEFEIGFDGEAGDQP